MTLSVSHKGLLVRAFAGALALAMLAAIPAVPAVAEPSAPATDTPPPATEPSTAAPETSPIPVPVDPATEAFRAELARKQAALDALEAQLDELDRELAIASEAYNKAVIDLESTQRHLTATKSDLAKAEVAYEIGQDNLSDRARDIYRNGDMHVLDVLLGSKSISDLMARIKFLHSVGENDADIAAALKAQRNQIAEAAKTAEQDELRARSLEFEQQARQIEVMLRIQEREELLASAQADLLALLEGQAAARQLEEAELLRQVLAGASSAGIIVEPGSPVETALAYHGVPYLWGGSTPAGFDCSGFMLYVFNQHGIVLPHYSGAQFLLGEKVAPADLKPGDVVFFGSPVYHVGMYVGAGYFIHAPHTGDFVKLSPLAERTDYAGARRYTWSYRTAPASSVQPAVTAQ